MRLASWEDKYRYNKIHKQYIIISVHNCEKVWYCIQSSYTHIDCYDSDLVRTIRFFSRIIELLSTICRSTVKVVCHHMSIRRGWELGRVQKDTKTLEQYCELQYNNVLLLNTVSISSIPSQPLPNKLYMLDI